MSFSLELNSGGASGPQPRSPSRELARKDVARILRASMVLLLVGLFGVLITCVVYKPLDSNPIYMAGVSLLLTPLAFYCVSLVRKRETQQVYFLRRLFRWSAALLITLFCLLIANGVLDHASPQQVQTVIVRKYATRSRRSTTCYVDVRSWRSGRSHEDLQVGLRTFSAISEGQRVSVELHPGFIGVAWYGRVTPL